MTYFSSREARVEESERSADVYRQVYDAERPELFFKSAAWRVAGDGQTIAVRADSAVDVPEPEVAVVINRFGEIAGYTACNDVSSRSIEGENPLYLPQAKIYLGGCALGPSVRPSWEVADPYDLGIELTIRRDGALAWQGRASTSALRRTFDELAGYLMRADIHPDGVVLSTGTCLVPPGAVQPGGWRRGGRGGGPGGRADHRRSTRAGPDARGVRAAGAARRAWPERLNHGRLVTE